MAESGGAARINPGFVPASPCVARDLRERTDLGAQIPLFGSREEAAGFACAALGPVLPSLPRAVNYVDFGGGQGAVAAAFCDVLKDSGQSVQANVVDANRGYLETAVACGLGGVLAYIEDCRLSAVDLASMRLVNHVNEAAAILGTRMGAGPTRSGAGSGAVTGTTPGFLSGCRVSLCPADGEPGIR